MDDSELQEIFTDPAHQEVVELLKSSRPAAPPLDPHFRSYLRAKLLTEARRTLPARPTRSWLPLSFSPKTLAPAMAAVAAGFLIVLGVEIYLHNPTTPAGGQVAAHIEQLNNKRDVATVEPIQIPFSGPVDKNAVAETVVIEPATSVTKQWVGSTLVIIPDHPLAPNTTYTVRLQPNAAAAAASPGAAATPSPTAAPTPVVVHFTTVRAPIPPVIPPSFKSTSVSYGHDSRLADSGTILNGTWTSAGQLLVTRPSGQPGPGALPTPSITPSPTGASAAKASADVWLMSPLGTPLREVAPGATLPSAPATGSMFAAWTMTSATQARLDVRDLQGNLISSIATINGVADRPAVWVGTDRVAYVDNHLLRLVDLHGTQIEIPQLKLDHGSLAASPNGGLLAVESIDGPVILDLGAANAITKLRPGASGFTWSARGELAFLVQHDSSSDLYVGADAKKPIKVASSQNGQSWSDLNWSPDSASLLLGNQPSGSNGTSSLLLINRDGSSPAAFGAAQREYDAPQWSPSGDLILFTRHDEAGGRAFWTATSSPSGNDAAEKQALAEVETFMQARIKGDSSAAQAELDDNGKAAYQAGASSLVSASGTRFDRYYPVTVQLSASNPNQFLIGVRIFIARSGTETSFFEEQLTLLEQGQRYRIHAVNASATMQLSHGPTVVSVEVLQNPPGQVVRIRFDADVKAETISGGTIQVKDQDGNMISALVTFDPYSHLASLAVRLRPGTYQLAVTTGVTDINGTPLAQEYDAPLVISR